MELPSTISQIQIQQHFRFLARNADAWLFAKLPQARPASECSSALFNYSKFKSASTEQRVGHQAGLLGAFERLLRLCMIGASRTVSVAVVVNWVKCVVPESRSRVPSTWQSSLVQAKVDARETPRKVRMKQSAIAAINRFSGDHRSPGPSNSAGGAVLMSGSPRDETGTSPVADPCALVGNCAGRVSWGRRDNGQPGRLPRS